MKTNSQHPKKKSSTKSNQEPSKKNWTWTFFTLLAVLFVFVFQYIFDEKLNLGGDNASYYILAKALAEGAGYTNIQLPVPTPHTHFPPGYPVLLAAFMSLGVNSIVGLKWVTGTFLLGSLLFFFQLVRRLSSDIPMAFTVTVLVLFNYHMLYYSTIMMSEIPFIFFTLWSLWLLLQLDGSKDWLKNPNFYFLIGVVTFAFHMRTIGIALIFAYVVYFLLNKRFAIGAVFLSGSIALSLPWQWRNFSIGGGSYFNQLLMKNPYRPEDGTMALSDWLARVGNNIYRYAASEIPSTFYPVLQIEYYESPNPSHLLIGIPIIVLSLFGLYAQKKHQLLVISYLAASFGILWLWPDIWFGPRFMLPLFPILLYLAVKGFQYLISTFTPVKQLSPYWFLLVVLVNVTPTKGLHQFAENKYLPEYERYFEAAKWVNKNTPETAIICTRKPNLFYLFANRPSTNYPYDTNYSSFLDTLAARGVTHIVMEQLGYSSGVRYLYPAIVANQEKIQTVYQTLEPQAYVFAFDNSYGYRGEWRVDGDVNSSKEPIIGVKEGQGAYYFKDGSHYQGDWENDARNGFGIMMYPDGSRYEGEWKNNRMEGKGKVFDERGAVVLEGIWFDDELVE